MSTPDGDEPLIKDNKILFVAMWMLIAGFWYTSFKVQQYEAWILQNSETFSKPSIERASEIRLKGGTYYIDEKNKREYLRYESGIILLIPAFCLVVFGKSRYKSK
nr:hypothetical protein [Polymorphobacter sp.]